MLGTTCEAEVECELGTAEEVEGKLMRETSLS